MIKNNKGMIGIYAAILMLILVSIMTIVLFNFSYCAGSISIKQEQAFRDYQNAALGAALGVWVIKNTAQSYPYGPTSINVTSPATSLSINLSGTIYTIQSTYNNKIVKVYVENGLITDGT